MFRVPYYGNASAADQQNKTAVWSNGYKGVWHLGENAANTTVADSSGTGNTGTNQANTSSKTAAGKVGNGLTFNGSSDWVSIASSAGLGSGLGSFTISAWVKKSSNSTVDAIVWHGDDSDGSGASYRFLTLTTGQIQYLVGNWNTGKNFKGSTIADTNWHYVTMTYDGTTLRGYYEGIADGSASSGTYTAADKVTRIGSAQASGASNYYADAVMDEVRIANVARSGDWIATEFNNQNSPGTFYTVGGQESGTTTVPVTVTSAPAGLLLTVDGAGCAAPCSFQWTPGTSHTVAPTAGTQAGAAGVQYVYASWSDGGAQSHSVTGPGAAATYTANFTTQYFLTTAANPAGGGSITPASGWVNSGSVVAVSASAAGGYTFTGFTGALAGTTTPQNVTMTGPLTVTATFGTGSAPGWYNTSWSNRKAVTVYHGQVAGAASLASFPMLFAVTDPNLKTVAKADGSDILFTAADGVTKLDHEMQQY
ncbi:MAG: LamG domain-containing protein, partial [Bryobacterales bacterium]|nr:LamG domain-containing protein [Bryobacterales bacterium]